MKKDLTSSTVSRQNILNNSLALDKIADNLNLNTVYLEGEMVFTKKQVAGILQIDARTVDRYIENNGEELEKNGYQVIKGNTLKKLKDIILNSDINSLSYGNDIDVVTKVSVLGLFSFRALLNLAMLVTESPKAKQIRNKMLDIVIDVVAQKSGGSTKYINQRDEDYLLSSYKEHNYRKEFTNALSQYLPEDKWKYSRYTNAIYKAVFAENAKEYKEVLGLKTKDGVRETMYAEVLNAIASFENGLATEIKQQFDNLGRKLTFDELNELIDNASNNPYLKPHIENAREKMASRDLCFRDALHQKLEHYIQSVPQSDFDKFLGETSLSLEQRLSDPETLAVLKRLKDR